jgi:hypothetical protein
MFTESPSAYVGGIAAFDFWAGVAGSSLTAYLAAVLFMVGEAEDFTFDSTDHLLAPSPPLVVPVDLLVEGANFLNWRLRT